MSQKEQNGLVDGVPSSEFLQSLINDYRRNVERFFDGETGAVREDKRQDGSPPFLFSEVTGYAIRDLLHLYVLTGEIGYVDAAAKAASWLVHTAATGDSWIRTRYYFEHDSDENLACYSFSGGNIFSFDNGICLNGLVALCEATQDQEILRRVKMPDLCDKTILLAENLVSLVGDDGSMPAFFNPRVGEMAVKKQCKKPGWSQMSGSFHTKIAEALVEAFLVFEKDSYAEAATRICEYALKRQEGDGRFITDSNGNTQLHPHCYSAEGMFRVGKVLKNEKFLNSAYRAVAWTLGQCCDGKIPQEVGSLIGNAPSFRTDALAQVLRLASLLDQSGRSTEDWWKSMSELAETVWAMKHPQNGYFRYGFYEERQQTNILRYSLSYWTNIFAFNSLLEYTAAWMRRHSTTLVLAGGIGSRCWPISCESLPKPLSRVLLGDQSLLEATVLRFLDAGCVQPKNVFVLTTSNGIAEARKQMNALQVPDENIIEEPSPKGTLGALRYAQEQIRATAQEILMISMADNLIKPLPAFRAALLKAAITAHWCRHGVILSLGVPNQACDSRFGHAFYRKDKEMAPDVYVVKRFIEKPRCPLTLEEGKSFAWDSGCLVSKFEYIRSIMDQLTNVEGDMSRQIMEKSKYHKAVSLYSPVIKFIDLGVPGKDLHQFFQGTSADRGDGNVFLGPKDVEVAFLKASRNIVISDRKPVVVVGLNDHLIIDHSYTNTAVTLPLDRIDQLPLFYRFFQHVKGFHPFMTGGPSARGAKPHHLAHDCSGGTRTDSKKGLALAVYCTDVRLERTRKRLVAVGMSDTQITDFDVDVLLTKKHDSALVRHLIDVAAIAEIWAKPTGLPAEAQELLHLFSLTHDIGGILTDDEIETERELASKIAQITRMEWTQLDSRVLQKLLRTAPKLDLTPRQQQMLTKFNDSINSAVEIMDIKELRSHRHFDELLFLLCYQGQPVAFRLSFQPTTFRLPFRSQFKMQANDLARIYSYYVAADIWVNAHCLWKRALRPHKEEDIAKTLLLISRWLNDAGLRPDEFVRNVNCWMCDQKSSFYRYTVNELRVTMNESGIHHLVPLYRSDQVYLALMEARRVDDRVKKAIINTLQDGERFEIELLLQLPSHVNGISSLVDLGTVPVGDLAIEVRSQCRQLRPKLWEELNEARRSLLGTLQ